jgi:hypothetical protein
MPATPTGKATASSIARRDPSAASALAEMFGIGIGVGLGSAGAPAGALGAGAVDPAAPPAPLP